MILSVKLKKIIFIFSLFLFSSNYAQIKLSLNTGNVISSDVKNKIGINLNAGIDSDLNRLEFYTPIQTSLKDLGVKRLRFPGGEKSNYYKWAQAPYNNANTNSWVPGYYADSAKNTMNFDQFMTICNFSGALPHVNVAYNPSAGFDENLAKEWVRYANITKKYNVKYWEIGNEMWHPNKNGLTTEELAQIVTKYSKAMKQIDPTIKIGTSLNNYQEIRKLLRLVGSELDFIAVSNYAIPESWSSFNSYQNSFNYNFMQAGAKVAIDAIKAENGNQKVVISEFNSIAWYPNTWENKNDLGHALVNFETIGQVLLEPKVEYACLWNTRWYVENGYPFSIFSAFDEYNLKTAISYPNFIWGKALKDDMVSIQSSQSISAFATKDKKGAYVSVLLLNKSSNPVNVSIPIQSNVVYDEEVEVFQFTGYDNDPKDFYPKYNQRPSIKYLNNEITNVSLPPVSVTVLNLQAKDCIGVTNCILSLESISDEKKEFNDVLIANSQFKINLHGKFKYQLCNAQGSILESGEKDGYLYISENLESGLFYLKLESATSSQILKILKL